MNWRTANLASAYAAGSEFDPNYSDGPDEPCYDTRTPEQIAADNAQSCAAWDEAGDVDNARRRAAGQPEIPHSDDPHSPGCRYAAAWQKGSDAA